MKKSNKFVNAVIETFRKPALMNAIHQNVEIQPTAAESIFIDAIRQADDTGNGEFNLSDEKATEMLAKYRASIMNEALKEAANRAVEYVFFRFDDDFNAKDITNEGLRAAIMGVPIAAGENKPESETLTGIQRITAERQRQIEKEGWTAEHDVEHGQGELARVAACYALRPFCPITIRSMWPDSWAYEWWKPTPKNRIRELEKSGALIAAEIDRLQIVEGQKQKACKWCRFEKGSRPDGSPCFRCVRDNPVHYSDYRDFYEPVEGGKA